MKDKIKEEVKELQNSVKEMSGDVKLINDKV